MRLATPLCTLMSSPSRSSKRPLRNLKSLSAYVARPLKELRSVRLVGARSAGLYGTRVFRRTWEGVVGVEEVDLLSAVSVHIAGRHSDGVSLRISQAVVRRTALVHRDVHEFVLGAVILQNQVWTVIPDNGQRATALKRGTHETCPEKILLV